MKPRLARQLKQFSGNPHIWKDMGGSGWIWMDLGGSGWIGGDVGSKSRYTSQQIPQTVFSCRGSGGVGKDAGCVVPPPREY